MQKVYWWSMIHQKWSSRNLWKYFFLILIQLNWNSRETIKVITIDRSYIIRIRRKSRLSKKWSENTKKNTKNLLLLRSRVWKNQNIQLFGWLKNIISNIYRKQGNQLIKIQLKSSVVEEGIKLVVNN